MNVDFLTAVKMFFANYTNFSGRSTRAEYWWATLFCLLVGTVCGAFGRFGTILSGVASLAFLLPNIAITIRRLHDTGRSGWWYGAYYLVQIVLLIWMMVGGLLPVFDVIAGGGTVSPALVMQILKGAALPFVIMFVIGIAWVVLMCIPSGPDNKYGPNPYGTQENRY